MVHKSEQMEYYKKELQDMADHVKKCDTAILDDIKYFKDEEAAYMHTLDTEVNDRIDYYIRKFKEGCKCVTSSKTMYD